MGTESWLTPNHLDSEFSPKYLGFTPFRRDRESGTSGGGIFVLVKDTFIASEQKQLKTDCEIVWVKIEMTTTKPLYVAAYYKPKDGDSKSAIELKRSLELADSLKGNIWLLGDFNYPKLSWNQDHVPSMKTGSSFPKHYEDFVNLLDDFSLVQMVSEPTSGLFHNFKPYFSKQYCNPPHARIQRGDRGSGPPLEF